MRVSSGFCSSPSPKLASHWLNRERSTAGSAVAASVSGGGVPPVVLFSVSIDGSDTGSLGMLIDIRVSARAAVRSTSRVFKDSAVKTGVGRSPTTAGLS